MNRITNQYLLMNTYQFRPTDAMQVKSSIEVLNANRCLRAWVLAWRAMHQHLINQQKLVLQTSPELMQATSYIILECLKIRAKFTGRVRLACIRRGAHRALKWISLMLGTVNQIEERSVKQVIPAKVAPIVLASRVPLPKERGQQASINEMVERLEKVEVKLLERCSGVQQGELGRKPHLTW